MEGARASDYRSLGMDVPLTYALVTPVRNEAENLARLADSIAAQTRLPEAWLIVDNGSTDTTLGVATLLAEEHAWVRVLSVPGEREPKPGAPIVRAFHAGIDALAGPVDVVVKLDADVSFAPDYFELLTGAFAIDPSLGLASGVCYEEENGEWGPTHVTGDHARGATRAYRWACLQDVLPLEVRVGWDTVDELKAGLRGWRTGIVADVHFLHHRAVGARDGARHSRARAQGRAAHYMGYRFLYLLARALYQARRDPAHLAMIGSYLSAALRREERCQDAEVRAYLREQQRLRRLPLRAREALGRRG